MSYENDPTYLRLAIETIEKFDDALRQAEGTAGIPVVKPTLWGDPVIYLEVRLSITDAQMQKLREITEGTPLIFIYERERVSGSGDLIEGLPTEFNS